MSGVSKKKHNKERCLLKLIFLFANKNIIIYIVEINH